MQKQCQYQFFMNFTVWVLEIVAAVIRWKKTVEFPKRRTDEKKTETKTAEKTEDNFQNFGFS